MTDLDFHINDTICDFNTFNSKFPELVEDNYVSVFLINIFYYHPD